ncbi:MAG: EVE domain-containing protein [Acidobacteria bacterium]|nr:EVE domain-containing protein [Acidobacteriota bacterium]MCA1641411.1 EVE domain-containing protein [Acidobacteriota bacterium]
MTSQGAAFTAASTYLLTWSPKKWRWEDLPRMTREIKRKGFCVTDWSCGNNKSIAEGDRLFLLRQGEEPRGIVGAGFADSEPFEEVHWREEKARAGRTTMYLRVRWETLLDPDRESIFPREWLNEVELSKVNWNTQISGINIRPEASEVLEERWADFLDGRGKGFSLFRDARSS